MINLTTKKFQKVKKKTLDSKIIKNLIKKRNSKVKFKLLIRNILKKMLLS